MSILDQLPYEKSPSRWLFLVIATYAFLYCNSYQFPTAFLIDWLWNILVPPFAKLLGNPNVMAIQATGSGDTYFNYYQLGLFLVLSIIIGSALNFLLKREKHFEILKKGIFMLVRYYIIFQMIIYGLSKIFYLQFQYPSDFAMEKRLGDMSPMGLLWTFMGYSKGYTMFTGWLEFIGGFFLIFRRTTVLGALITLGVMLNVFMLNMCYDVPVKLLSGHVVLLSIFLIYPKMKDLFKYFFTNEDIERSEYPFFDYKKAGKLMLGFKLGIFTLACVGMMGSFYSNGAFEVKDLIFKDKFDVKDFAMYRNGIEMTDLQDHEIWKSTLSMYDKYLAIQLESEEQARWYELSEDTTAHVLELQSRFDSLTFRLDYKEVGQDSFKISGMWYGDSLTMHLIKSKEEFLLKSRKFNWIQDYPFNR